MARKPDNGVVNWRELDRRHKEALARKRERIEMYGAIIHAWELRENRDEDYLRDLRRRFRSEQTQLSAMKP